MAHIWVFEHAGVPGEELFNSAQGLSTPIIIDNTTQIAYYYDAVLGVTAIAGSGGGGPGSDGWTYLILTADVTAGSASPAVIPGLAFTPVSGSEYRVEGQLLVETNLLDNGPSPGVSWPSGLTSGVIRLSVPESSTGEALLLGNISANSRAVPSTFPVNTALPCEISATFLSGGAVSGDFAITISSAV